MKKKLLGIVFLILAASFLYGGITSTVDNSTTGGIIMCALFAFLGLRWLFGGKRAAAPVEKRTPTAPTTPAPDRKPSQYRHINFNVAGVTFKNDDGSDRQRILRKIKFADPPFDDQDNLFVSITPYTFEGEQAYAVLVNDHQIGSVPRSVIPQVEIALSKPDVAVSAFQVVGGGSGYSYGAEVTVRYTD